MEGEDLIRVVEFNGIGKVSFIKKTAVRNMKITIKPFKGVQVTLPKFVSFESAGKFVEEKKQWIRSSQLKLTRFENKRTIFNPNVPYSTNDHRLILEKHNRATIKTVISQGIIRVTYPDFADAGDIRIQTAVRKAVHRAWRIEATRYIPERVEELARVHNLSYRRLTFRDNKTRWGSCSRDNNINLSIHLVRLPEALCEYVILHELAHTVYKHHQASFWNYLDHLTGGKAKMLDKELNKYSPEVW